MRKSKIDEANRLQVARQREFRAAADVIATAFTAYSEVVAVAVIGSAAKPLWKEVPRFREFRRASIEIWHECNDLDLTVWLDSLDRLGELRRARDLALWTAYEAGPGPSITGHQAIYFCSSRQATATAAGCAASTNARRAKRIVWFPAAV